MINHWYCIFREVIYRYQITLKDKLLGKVKADESYFGAKRLRGYGGKLKHSRGTLRQPVFGVFEPDGKVYTEIVPGL